MSGEILMATNNPHKTERFKYYLNELGLTIVSYADIKKKVEVIEDGKTPEENALKKAKAGHDATGMTTFGVDYWFFIEGIPDEIQPGPYVRRIFTGKKGARKEATDEEMLDYYTKLIADLGGKTKGLWRSAIAMVTRAGKSYADSSTRDTVLTSVRSPNETRGEPLNSVQIDPKSGKYFTDMTKEEWLRLQSERERGYIRFFESHLDEL